MVDSIGSRQPVSRDAVAPVTGVPRTQQVVASKPDEAGHDQTVSSQLEVSALAFDFGKAAPVQEARVEEIRRAVRNGTYPILPETIADRLLALKLNWTPKK